MRQRLVAGNWKMHGDRAFARELLDVMPDAEEAPLDEPIDPAPPCPCCGGPMRIIETFRRGQKPMSRAPPREQAA